MKFYTEDQAKDLLYRQRHYCAQELSISCSEPYKTCMMAVILAREPEFPPSSVLMVDAATFETRIIDMGSKPEKGGVFCQYDNSGQVYELKEYNDRRKDCPWKCADGDKNCLCQNSK